MLLSVGVVEVLSDKREEAGACVLLFVVYNIIE
jgi:hypothetical protein